MTFQPLPKKQRALLDVFPDEEHHGWLTLPEIRDYANGRLALHARRADRFSDAFVRRVVDHWMDLGIVDYRRAMSTFDRHRPGADEGLWRLTVVGAVLRAEVQRGVSLERRLK